MVDEKKVRKVLPKIFVNGDPRYRKPLYEYQSKERKLRRIERRKKVGFNFRFRKIVKAFDDLERWLNDLEFEF